LSKSDVWLPKLFRQPVPQCWPGGGKTAVTELVAWCVLSYCRQCTTKDFVFFWYLTQSIQRLKVAAFAGDHQRRDNQYLSKRHSSVTVDWIEQGLTSHSTHFTSFRRRLCYSVCHTSSVSSILKAIFPMLSPTRLKSRITPALDRAEVLVARGRSPSTSRKSTKLGSVCRSGWAATRFMNLSNNIYFCHTDRSS